MSYIKPYDIHLGNCLEVLKGIPDNSVDSIVTDPPYGLSFMGKKWDYDVPEQAIWEECLRVLKPGGHLLAFAGTRTQHRMAVRIEDAGFEIRDMIAWVYGSGFPKSMDVSKAIDKAHGAEREVLGTSPNWRESKRNREDGGSMEVRGKNAGLLTSPATDAARQWQGWGTALKPALEPITVARKPLIGTVAANVLAHGTGALNIDGCRVGNEERLYAPKGTSTNASMIRVPDHRMGTAGEEVTVTGRWPANLIHDGSDEVLDLFPETKSGVMKAGTRRAAQDEPGSVCYGTYGGNAASADTYGDAGSAARFFYCAKTSRKDRNEGLDGFEGKTPSDKTGRKEGSVGLVGDHDNKGQTANPFANGGGISQNNHPTVKPTDLMAYLCRLVTPPGGVVLDPFMGSGSTGKAAMREGFRFIGIEMDESYLKIAEARIAHEAGK